jgi:homocitrate synthase NifV
MIAPHIIDTTLRDGEQGPGVVFHLHEKMLIAELLESIGIPELEIGTPIMGSNEIADMREIVNAGFNFKTLSWCRATKADIDAAGKTYTDGVNISIPVSDIHLKAMNKDRRWVLSSLRNIVQYASQHFSYIAIGAQDASRADISFLFEFISEASQLHVQRVRIADTVGILNPLSVQSLFRNIIATFPFMSFEFHGHNDLGMATANTIMAICCGVQSASVTVNGLGERAGNASLAELVMALELSNNIHLDVNKIFLDQLSKAVSAASGIPIPENKPVVGRRVLSHESGIHTNLIVQNRNTYQIINASQVGRHEAEFVFGKHTGSAAIKEYCWRNNIVLPEHCYRELTEEVKQRSLVLKRSLSPEEILRTVRIMVDRLPEQIGPGIPSSLLNSESVLKRS